MSLMRFDSAFQSASYSAIREGCRLRARWRWRSWVAQRVPGVMFGQPGSMQGRISGDAYTTLVALVLVVALDGGAASPKVVPTSYQGLSTPRRGCTARVPPAATTGESALT